MIRVTPKLCCLALPVILAACSGEKQSAKDTAAFTEVLPGSASDAMVSYDGLRSQPPLAPKPAASGKPGASSKGADKPDGSDSADKAPAAETTQDDQAPAGAE